MVVFISALLPRPARGGTVESSLPAAVVAAALVLGRQVTGLLLLLILCCRLLVGLLAEGPAWLAMPVLIGLFAELAPTLLVAFLTCALSNDLDRATRTIRFLAERDDLTGLYNLRIFSKLADVEFASARAAGTPCALLMIDVEQLDRSTTGLDTKPATGRYAWSPPASGGHARRRSLRTLWRR